jgi:hypothetical protein
MSRKIAQSRPVGLRPFGRSHTHFPGIAEKAAYRADLLKLWKRAVAAGHEVANHTNTHETAGSHIKNQWVKEIRDCQKHPVDHMGVPGAEIQGFRTPYLDFGKGTFDAIQEAGLLFEATVTHQGDYNKRQHVWPYTLHKGFSERSIGPAGALACRWGPFPRGPWRCGWKALRPRTAA